MGGGQALAAGGESGLKSVAKSLLKNSGLVF